MERGKGSQYLVIAILSIAILTMSIGFAVMAQTLNINGNATVKGSLWSVAFDTNASNTTVTAGSVTDNKPAITATTVTFDATFDTFGQFYEFKVPVLNKGTYDAVLKSINMSSLTADQQKYLTYTVTYNNGSDHEYTASTTGLNYALAKESGVHYVTVRVQYFEPTAANVPALPQEDVTVALTATFNYEQAVA